MAKSRKTDAAATATTVRLRKGRPKAAAVAEPDIARRAYDLYLRRGHEHGHDLDDWIQAEQELQASGAASEKR